MMAKYNNNNNKKANLLVQNNIYTIFVWCKVTVVDFCWKPPSHKYFAQK